MEKKHKSKWVFILGGILILISLVTAGAYEFIKWLNGNKREQAAPLTIQIISPEAGETFPTGESVIISATAVGHADIQRMEIWLDGQKVEQIFNDAGTSGIFSGFFETTISEGGHMLSVRAIDQEGLIGQSLPIPVYGSSEMAETALPVYTAQEGDTLGSIAEGFGLDEDTINTLNPELGAGGLAEGTQVNLPINGDNEPQPEQPPAAAVQPGPPVDVPNNPMLPEISQANPIINAVKGLMQLKPPAAPSELKASYQDCQVTLTWNDNSTSEDSFRIWFAGLGVPPRVIATVKSSDHTGPVWYRFNTPPAGVYSFWVEAVNGIGSQPSEEFWIGIPATQCEDYTAAYLFLSVERFEIFGNYDSVYCYISVEGAPEQRFPSDDSLFLEISTEQERSLWGDFFNVDEGPAALYYGGARSFTIPYPEDNDIYLEGECLAWGGDVLVSLGEFGTSLRPNDWDFADAEFIETPNFIITITVRPFGWENPEGTYTFSDPSIQAPFNLEEIDTGNRGNPFHPTDRILTWKWKGDESAITGFTVFLNDNPFKLALPHERQVYYSLPAICGACMRFKVATNLPNGQTDRSEALEYCLEPCPLRAEVQFVSIETGFTNDSFRGKCDPIEAYFNLVAWGTTTASSKLGHGSGYGWRYPMTCSTLYTFDDIFYALTRKRDLDRMIVQIDPYNPHLLIGVFGWDYDWGSQNDPLVMIKKEIPNLPVTSWEGYEEEFSFSSLTEAAWTRTIIRVKALTGPEF